MCRACVTDKLGSYGVAPTPASPKPIPQQSHEEFATTDATAGTVHATLPVSWPGAELSLRSHFHSCSTSYEASPDGSHRLPRNQVGGVQCLAARDVRPLCGTSCGVPLLLSERCPPDFNVTMPSGKAYERASLHHTCPRVVVTTPQLPDAVRRPASGAVRCPPFVEPHVRSVNGPQDSGPPR
jgi:hypothetical protein